MNIYYDEVADYLEIFIEDSKSNYGEDLEEGVTLFKNSKTDEVVGFGVIGFKKRAQDLSEIKINLPVDINFSALKV